MAVEGNPAPAISIIVPCLGHADELAMCLNGLAGQRSRHPFEIILVDSASDPEVLAVATRHPEVRLFRSPRRLTSGAARNLGSREAAADLLAFMDADCIPEAGWVERAVEGLRAEAVMLSGSVADALPWHFIAASDNRLQFADFSPRRPRGRHAYFPAGTLAIRRKVFEELGRFDEVSMVAQDVLFTRVVAEKYPDRALFEPRMLVRHVGRRRWKDYLDHQYAFGWSRSEYRLRMDSSYDFLARHPALGAIVMARRLAYIALRVVHWNLPDLPRFLLQVPFLIPGLIAWTRGFHAGAKAHPATKT